MCSSDLSESLQAILKVINQNNPFPIYLSESCKEYGTQNISLEIEEFVSEEIAATISNMFQLSFHFVDNALVITSNDEKNDNDNYKSEDLNLSLHPN